MKKQYYLEKIKNLEEGQKLIIKKSRNISILRLLIVVLGLVFVYQMFSLSTFTGFISLAVLLIVYIWTIRIHNKTFKTKKKYERLLSIYNNEIDLNKSSNLFGDGINHLNNLHEYSSDLDIFGKFSLFNLINRTSTHEGENLLSKWLLNTTQSKKTILEKQGVIKELASKTDFKENFLITYFIADKKDKEANKINNWISVFKYFFWNKKLLKIVLYILSLLTITFLLVGFINPFWWKYSTLLIIINFFIIIKFKRPVDLVHEHISQQEQLFLKYSTLIKHIKSEKFENPYLIKLQNKLLEENQIEKQLKLLSNLIKNLDYRLNVVMASFLNLLLFWDIHYTCRVENWMKKNAPNIEKWLSIIGEFDALISLSILHFNNPDWNFPTIKTDSFTIEGKNIGHPLIEKENRVDNDYSIIGNGKFDIITGSNMAGKSTFLRTIGINSILALNGCPVCADSFSISNIRLITYMRIIDSLEDNLSTFHAELERIKSILKYVEKNENCFLLLDELLRGTNSQDRHIGTVALIKQMLKNKTSGIIATHDLSLTDMINEHPNDIRNYNFGVKTKDNDLYFDYKLTDGVCDSFNASILMKKIGIDIEM